MPQMRTISVSLRLTAWFGAIFLIGWLLFGAAMWFTLKHTLSEERHQTLERRLDRLQELLRHDQISSTTGTVVHDFAAATGNGLISVTSMDGASVLPPASAAASSFPWPRPIPQKEEQFRYVRSGNQFYWVLQRPTSIGSTQVVLAAAAPASGNLLVLDQFSHGLLLSAPVLLIVSMAGGYWISRRALLPVDRITSAARLIGIRNLAERIPVTASRDEIQRLAETCNEMLDRIETSMQRQNRFTADASHELRGPLSIIRVGAEVALLKPILDPELTESLQQIVIESEKAAKLLDALLLLARADAEAATFAFENVELNALVERTCTKALPFARDREIDLQIAPLPTEDSMTLAHSPSLERILWVLIDNALKYTHPGGRVDVTLRPVNASVEIEVKDTGVGIEGSDLPFIFDRFYRADPSRSESEGNGLGLSIAQWLAGIHDGTITVRSKPGHGSAFTLTLQKAE